MICKQHKHSYLQNVSAKIGNVYQQLLVFVSNALFIFCVPLRYIYTNTQKKWIIQSSLSG